MNIVVLGSNCKFSSDLAIKLNTLKDSSLVFRYDALNCFKEIVPLYNKLLNLQTSKNKKSVTITNITEKNEGNYIGDIENSFLNKSTEGIDKLQFIFDALNNPVDNSTFNSRSIINKINLIDRKNIIRDNLTLKIINIFSGIMDTHALDAIAERYPIDMVIYVNNNDTYLTDTFSIEKFKQLEKEHKKALFFNVKTLNVLLNNKAVKNLLGLNFKKENVINIQQAKKEEPEIIGNHNENFEIFLEEPLLEEAA